MTKEYLEAAVRDAREAEAYAIALEEAFIAAMRHVAEFSNDAHLVKWSLGVIAEMEGREMSEDLVKILRADDGDWRTDQAADRIEELEAERDAALVALFECMEEIDAYIQQEYPHDHPVHERYRQRDYGANPARIFLRDRPDALVKARAMLAEADLERQTATLKGQTNARHNDV